MRVVLMLALLVISGLDFFAEAEPDPLQLHLHLHEDKDGDGHEEGGEPGEEGVKEEGGNGERGHRSDIEGYPYGTDIGGYQYGSWASRRPPSGRLPCSWRPARRPAPPR